ncbi:MAG: ParA family protein [Gammaproteobacteria bacterium]|nr:ParA family protein [Gammaproteobacteria bacterium]
MTVIALASSKGGVGKTTLTMNLAAGLSRRDSTVVVDADPQQSSGQWSLVAEEGVLGFDVAAADGGTAEVIAGAGHGYRYVLVDCPPSFAAPQTQEVLRQADLLLIPMQPSPLDLWSGANVVEWVSLAKRANPRLSAWVVLNQVEPNTRLWKDVKEALEELGLPSLRTTVRRRAAFRNAALTGTTVYAIGSRGTPAVEEIEAVITEVLSHDREGR